jgi:hypothetical protein
MYSTVPKVGAAAFRGKLPPRADSTLIPYGTVGPLINEYPSFPVLVPNGSEPPPRAQLWIFTTDKNPISPGIPLSPLYRMSFKCGDAAPSLPCTANPVHVDHTYAVSAAEVQNFLQVGYKLDGLEGYLFPLNQPQPVGTVTVYRGYNGSVYGEPESTADDWAVYPESELGTMAAQGFRTNLLWTGPIGYAYLNTGPRPAY